MIPWDLDNSLSAPSWAGATGAPTVYLDVLQEMGRRGTRPLTEYLFRQPEHRQRYLAHIRTIMSESMGLDGIQQTVDGMQNLVENAASDDTNSLFPMSFFSTNVNNTFWADWGLPAFWYGRHGWNSCHRTLKST